MDFLYLICYACLRLRFLDVGTNPVPRLRVPDVCIILCSYVRGLVGNLSDLTMASSQYDIVLCSETLVSDMRLVSEILVPVFSRPFLLSWQDASGPRDGCIRTYEIVADYFANPNLSVVFVKCWFLGCGVRQNLYVFSLYLNPNLDARII